MSDESLVRFAVEKLAAERALLTYERLYRDALLALDPDRDELERAARRVAAAWPEGRDGLPRLLNAARERAYAAASAETLEYAAI